MATLFDAVCKALLPQVSQPLIPEVVAIDQQHGRIEALACHVLEAGALASQFPDWPDLKTIGVAVSCRTEKKATFDIR